MMRIIGVLILAVTAGAEDLAIKSFGGNGQLTFNEIPTATMYRVEWANAPTGIWHVGSPGLTGIVANGSGQRMVTVGVSAECTYYRVVATVTNAGISVPEGMVLIPGGTNAGTDPDFGAYSLTVDPFYMDRYEVTKALWDAVYTWAVSNEYGFINVGSGKAAGHPVHYVNWQDCVKWCNARSQKEGRAPVYYVDAAMTQVYKTGQVLEPYVKASANGYRLPTDTQWHYAARGGVANRRFPWGDSDTIQHIRANYYSSSSYSYDTSPTRGYHPTYNDGTTPYTNPSGSFAPNGYGLYDMAGNVWEWCYDWYPGSEGSNRVVRGGGWGNNADSSRVAYRGSGASHGAYLVFGFRTVLPSGL